jgi:hypothetical protein
MVIGQRCSTPPYLHRRLDGEGPVVESPSQVRIRVGAEALGVTHAWDREFVC